MSINRPGMRSTLRSPHVALVSLGKVKRKKNIWCEKGSESRRSFPLSFWCGGNVENRGGHRCWSPTYHLHLARQTRRPRPLLKGTPVPLFEQSSSINQIVSGGGEAGNKASPTSDPFKGQPVLYATSDSKIYARVCTRMDALEVHGAAARSCVC